MKASTYLPIVLIFATTLAPPVAWAQVFPVAHCIEIQPGPPIPGGRLPVFVTYFGYTNLGSSTVLIPRGVSNHNFFYPGNSLGNSWPNTFLPGYHPFAVALVWNLSPSFQETTVNWVLSGNFATLAMPTEGTVNSPLAVTAPFCSVAVTSSAQILSTTGTALAQKIAGVRGDFGNPTTVVTPIGVTGGAGGISVSNLVYTRSRYEPSLRFFIPGYITADIAVSAWATPAQFAFQIAADGEPTQHISIPISYIFIIVYSIFINSTSSFNN